MIQPKINWSKFEWNTTEREGMIFFLTNKEKNWFEAKINRPLRPKTQSFRSICVFSFERICISIYVYANEVANTNDNRKTCMRKIPGLGTMYVEHKMAQNKPTKRNSNAGVAVYIFSAVKLSPRKWKIKKWNSSEYWTFHCCC